MNNKALHFLVRGFLFGAFFSFLRFMLVPNSFCFPLRFWAMELHQLYLSDFMQIDSLNTFPGVVVSNGKKLSAFKQKTLGHKVDGFCRLCPGTMKRPFEHNALASADCLTHHHMGAPDILGKLYFFSLPATLPAPETSFFS